MLISKPLDAVAVGRFIDTNVVPQILLSFYPIFTAQSPQNVIERRPKDHIVRIVRIQAVGIPGEFCIFGRFNSHDLIQRNVGISGIFFDPRQQIFVFFKNSVILGSTNGLYSGRGSDVKFDDIPVILKATLAPEEDGEKIRLGVLYDEKKTSGNE